MFSEIFERGNLNTKKSIKQIQNILDALEKINNLNSKGNVKKSSDEKIDMNEILTDGVAAKSLTDVFEEKIDLNDKSNGETHID